MATPNMNLTIPTAGVTEGPEYANEINADLTLIDQHNHAPGYGVPVPPSGININADLTFSGNNATNLRSIRFTAQGSPLALGTDLDCIYVSGVDLWYNDGDGNQVQITDNGGVAGSPGNITNLAPPASVTYVSGTPAFVFQSNTNIAANLDAGAVVFRNITPNSTFGVTVQPVAALAANYTLVLPQLPPGQQIMTLDNSGNMAAPYTVDNDTIVINANVIEVGVIDGATNIADGSIPVTKLADGISTSTVFTTSSTFVVPTAVQSVIFTLIGGGGGGGGGGGAGGGAGATGGGGGAGGAAGAMVTQQVSTVPGDIWTYTIGAGGGGGTFVVGNNGTSGAAGGDTYIQRTTGGTTSYIVARGGVGGAGGRLASVGFPGPTDGSGGAGGGVSDLQSMTLVSAAGGVYQTSPTGTGGGNYLSSGGGGGGAGGRRTGVTSGAGGAGGGGGAGGAAGEAATLGGGGGGGGGAGTIFGTGGGAGGKGEDDAGGTAAGAGAAATSIGAGGGGGGGGALVGTTNGNIGGAGAGGAILITYIY